MCKETGQSPDLAEGRGLDGDSFTMTTFWLWVVLYSALQIDIKLEVILSHSEIHT
jgi:hypothetical protein